MLLFICWPLTLLIDLTLLYVQYTNLEILFPKNFVWWFVIWWGPRTNSALLTRWQLWATLVILINPRWPPEPIWKISFQTNYLRMLYKPFFMGFHVCTMVFILFSGHGYVKNKMSVQRHLENRTVGLIIVEWRIVRLFKGFKVCRMHIWCYPFNFKSWLGHIFICRILSVLFWKLGVQCKS